MAVAVRIRRSLAHCWACIAYVLIGAAVLLTLLRLAAPWLSDYRDALADQVAARLDAPVSIGRLGVEWHLLGPGLKLVDVRIGGDRPDALEFERARLDLTLSWDTVEGIPLRLAGLELVGLDLSARVDRQGRVHWRQFTFGAQGADSGDSAGARAAGTAGRNPLAWLRSVGELRVRDLRVNLTLPDGERATLYDTNVRLLNGDEHCRVTVLTGLARGADHRLRLTAHLEPPATASEPWRWRLYAQAGGLDLQRWLALWPKTPVALTSGQVEGEVWLWGRGGRLERAVAKGATEDVALVSPAQGEPVRFERIGGRWGWTRTARGWRVSASEVSVERNDRTWPQTAFVVERATRSDGPAAWRGRLAFADIGDLTALARALPLPEPLAQHLEQRRPRGRARGVEFHWRGLDGLALRGRFDQLGWAPGRSVPGMTGLDLRLRVDGTGGTVQLETADAAMRMPSLFRRPLPIAHLAGRLHVARADDGALRIASDGIAVANGDIAAHLRFAVDLTPGEPARIDARGSFGQGRLGAIQRYLPARIMDPEAVAWFDRALRRGRVSNGSFVWRGPVTDFPYRNGGGRFRVDFTVDDGRVAFDPEWPALKRMDGRVHFDGPRLSIEARRGRFLQGQIGAFHLRWPELEQPRLTVDAGGKLPMTDVIRLATQTPLREALGEALRGAEGAGEVDVDLHLDLPLERPEQAGIKGRFRVAGVSLAQPRFGLALTGIRGRGTFDKKGVEIDAMRARQHGQPVRIDATHRPGTPPRVRFRVTGTLAPGELLPRDAQALRALGHGRARWHVSVSAPTGEGSEAYPVILQARSQLRGTAVDLPPPLAKPTGTTRELAVRLRFGGGDREGRAWFNYGGTARGVLALVERADEPEVARATFRFGGGNPRLVAAPGLVLAGRIERLPIQPWLRWLRRDDPGGDAGQPEPGLRVSRAELELGRVSLGPYGARAVTADAQRMGNTMRLELASEALAGSLEVPTATAERGTVRARLAHADWRRLRPNSAEHSARHASDEPTPSSLPPLDVRIERLHLDSGTLHQAALVSRPVADGHRIHRLGFNNPGVRLRAQGHWRDGRSRFRIQLEGNDYGSGLGELGYPELLEGGKGRVTAELAWPGPPWDPNLAALEGHANLALKQGRLRQLDVGPAKLLGLFSLNLTGMLESGFTFSTLAGRIDFSGGNAFMRGVTIRGGPGRIRVDGRAGLVARDYDQIVRFQPELSGSLTVLGALSGGPAGGVAGALLEGLLRGVGVELGAATTLKYRLTGSWADPNVRLIEEQGRVEQQGRGRPGRGGP